MIGNFWSRVVTWRRLAILLFVMGMATAGAAWIWRSKTHHDLLVQAEAELTARDYETAQKLLEEFLYLYPNHAHARLLAARTARKLKNYASAWEHLRQTGDSPRYREGADIEQHLLSLQKGDESGIEFLRTRASQEDDLALVILEPLIQLDLDQYRLRQAMRGLAVLLKHRPTDLHALLARGFLWERFLNFSDAVEDYRKAVASHPTSEPARLKLAAALLIVGTPNEALEQYQWLAERKPKHPAVLLGLAKCSRLLGQTDVAKDHAKHLLEIAPNDGEGLWEMGQLHLDAGLARDAEPWLRKAAAKVPFDRRIQYSMYRCLLALDRGEEAKRLDERIKQLDADLRQLDKIRNQVLERPNDPNLRAEGGILFLRNGEREEGVRWLRRAVHLDPNHTQARRALADLDSPSSNR